MAILVNIRDFIFTNLLSSWLVQVQQCNAWTTIHDYIFTKHYCFREIRENIVLWKKS